MRTLEMVIGLVIVALSLFGVFWVIPNYVEPSDFTQISPAFLPNVSVVLIGILGLLLFLSRLFSDASSGEPLPFTAMDLAHIGSIVGIFSVGAAIIINVDFIVGGALLVAALMFYMNERRLVPILLIPLATPVALFVFFELLLGINLP